MSRTCGGDAWAPPLGCYRELLGGASSSPGPRTPTRCPHTGSHPHPGRKDCPVAGTLQRRASHSRLCPSGWGPGWGALMHGPLALGLRWRPPWRPEELVGLTPHPWGAGPWLASSLPETPFSAGRLGLWVVGGAEWSCWAPGPLINGCLNPHGSELRASGAAGVRQPWRGHLLCQPQGPRPAQAEKQGLCPHPPGRRTEGHGSWGRHPGEREAGEASGHLSTGSSHARNARGQGEGQGQGQGEARVGAQVFRIFHGTVSQSGSRVGPTSPGHPGPEQEPRGPGTGSFRLLEAVLPHMDLGSFHRDCVWGLPIPHRPPSSAGPPLPGSEMLCVYLK